MWPGCSYSKIDYLKDAAVHNNCFVLTMTESHLNAGISDGEITIPGWCVYRSDRLYRSGGGIVTYVQEHLTVSDESSHSESITEILCLYIHETKTAQTVPWNPFRNH